MTHRRVRGRLLGLALGGIVTGCSLIFGTEGISDGPPRSEGGSEAAAADGAIDQDVLDAATPETSTSPDGDADASPVVEVDAGVIVPGTSPLVLSSAGEYDITLGSACVTVHARLWGAGGGNGGAGGYAEAVWPIGEHSIHVLVGGAGLLHDGGAGGATTLGGGGLGGKATTTGGASGGGGTALGSDLANPWLVAGGGGGGCTGSRGGAGGGIIGEMGEANGAGSGTRGGGPGSVDGGGMGGVASLTPGTAGGRGVGGAGGGSALFPTGGGGGGGGYYGGGGGAGDPTGNTSCGAGGGGSGYATFMLDAALEAGTGATPAMLTDPTRIVHQAGTPNHDGLAIIHCE